MIVRASRPARCRSRGASSARRARGAEQRADDRDRAAREGELPAHEHHQPEAEEQEAHAGQRVLHADDLVVGGEDVLAPEAQLVVVRLVGMGPVDRLGHTCTPPGAARCPGPAGLGIYFFGGPLNVKSAVLASVPAIVTEAVCAGTCRTRARPRSGRSRREVVDLVLAVLAETAKNGCGSTAIHAPSRVHVALDREHLLRLLRIRTRSP